MQVLLQEQSIPARSWTPARLQIRTVRRQLEALGSKFRTTKSMRRKRRRQRHRRQLKKKKTTTTM